MTDAKTLVARLRGDAASMRTLSMATLAWGGEMDKAADAIEELTAALRRLHRFSLPITANDVEDDRFARTLLTKYGASNG